MVFAKRGFAGEVPLYFLEIVTDRVILDFVTLGDFRKARICGGSAIIFFGDCHRSGDSRHRDIK